MRGLHRPLRSKRRSLRLGEAALPDRNFKEAARGRRCFVASGGPTFSAPSDAREEARDFTRGAIRIGQDEFQVEVAKHGFRAERGQPEEPDFTLAAPVAPPLAAAIYGKLPFDELAAAGLKVDGDSKAALRFIDLFHLPEKFAAA